MELIPFSVQSQPNIEQLLSHVAKKYVNYCGTKDNKTYEKGYWESVQECLTDGKVHLVYSNKGDGTYGIHQLKRSDPKSVVTFAAADKTILMDAIYEGATIYASEYSNG